MSSLSEPFAVAAFRGMWLARALSLVGDQLARVALAVLVFDRTGSAGWTGVVYALTYLPYLAGPLFAGIADRRSRRAVMISLDLARAALVGLMALGGMPLVAMCALLVLATALSPVYDAARSATLPNLLSAELYPTGLAVFSITTEAAQVVGFACGGFLVAGVGARPALALDALTYLVAGLAIAMTVPARPAPARSLRESGRAALRSAARLTFGSPWMRSLVSLAWINALWMVPEGLAAPYAARLGAGPVAVGALLAAIPAGGVIGAALLTRLFSHERRLRLMPGLALLASVPLIGCLAHPGLGVTLALWVTVRDRHLLQRAGQRRVRAGPPRPSPGAGDRARDHRHRHRPGSCRPRCRRPRRRVRAGGGRRRHGSGRCRRRRSPRADLAAAAHGRGRARGHGHGAGGRGRVGRDELTVRRRCRCRHWSHRWCR